MTTCRGGMEGGGKVQEGRDICILTANSPIISWEIDGETVKTVSDFIFWAPKSLQMVTAAMKLKDTYSLEGKL